MQRRLRYANKGDLGFLLEGLKDNRVLEVRPREQVRPSRVEKEALGRAIRSRNVRVVEVEGKAAGFLYFRTDFTVMYVKRDGTFWVDLIYVKKSHRGGGLGRLLYEDAIEIARKGGFSRIVIDVFAANTGSREFHERLGFSPVYTIYQKEL